jgi:replicative DNA helicase Mcm
VVPSLSEPIYPFELVAKYINYIRNNLRPRLVPAVHEYLTGEYMILAKPEKMDGQSYFSYRLLTNIIRLSQASAKLRLSDKVGIEDVQRAMDLLIASLKAQGAITDRGTINYERVEGVPSREKRDKIHQITNLIRELCVMNSEHLADLVDIVKGMEIFGVDAVATEELIAMMKRAGELMEPRRNKYQMVGE